MRQADEEILAWALREGLLDPARAEWVLRRASELARTGHADAFIRALGEVVPARQLPRLQQFQREAARAGLSISETRTLAGAASSPAPETPAPPPPSGRIGNYRLLEELGRGGMGVVYRALDPRLQREVALKSIQGASGREASSLRAERFLREARAAAKLQHPHIVAVHEIGEHEGAPYLVMDYVPGETLAAAIEGARLTRRAALTVVRDVARALEFAHRHDVVHRDVKPENILLDAGGCPHLVDFGLARDLSEERHLTVEGQLLGTPSFMAPEQARGDPSGIGAHTDVYSLGGLLHFVLSGEPPFTGEGVLDLIYKVCEEPPPPLREVDPTIHVDLETIALRCLEKEPPRRYPSAEAVAAELQRFLDGEPIQARPAGRWERTRRWAARRPALAALCAVFLCTVGVLLAAGAVGVVYGVQRIRRERDVARQERRAAEQAERTAHAERDRAHRERERADEARAEALRAAERAAGARELAERARARTAAEARAKDGLLAEALAGRGWRALDDLRHGVAAAFFARSLELQENPSAREGLSQALPRLERTVWSQPRRSLVSVACSPDGKWVAVGANDGGLYVVDRELSRIVRRYDGAGGWLGALVFSRDGSRVYAGGEDGRLRVWDLNSASPGRTWQAHADAISDLSTCPGGRIASAGLDGSIRLWSLDGSALWSAPGDGGMVSSLALDPRGEALISGGEDGILRWWALASGRQLHARVAHETPVCALAAGPTVLASGSARGTVRLWDPATREPRGEVLAGDGPVLALAAADRGSVVAWGAANGSVRFYDPERGVEAGACFEHANAVYGIAFGGDGSHVVTASADGTARLISAESFSRSAALQVGRPLHRIALRPAGDLLATMGRARSGQVVLRDASDGREQRSFHTGDTTTLQSLAFSPDGDRLATGGSSLRLWRPAETRRPVEFPGSARSDVAFTPAGHLLAHDAQLMLRLWNQDGKALRLAAPGKSSWAQAPLATCPTGTIARGEWDGSVSLWDADTGAERGTLRGHDAVVTRLAFSADGTLLFTLSSERLVAWDPQTQVKLGRRMLRVGADTLDVAGAGADVRVAIGTRDGTVRLFAGPSLAPWKTVATYPSRVVSVALTPDDQLILACEDGTLERWAWDRAPALERYSCRAKTLGSERGTTRAIGFSGGSLLELSDAGPEGSPQIWDHSEGQLVATLPPGREVLAATPDLSTIVTWRRARSAPTSIECWRSPFQAPDASHSLEVRLTSYSRARLDPTGRWLAVQSRLLCLADGTQYAMPGVGLGTVFSRGAERVYSLSSGVLRSWDPSDPSTVHETQIGGGANGDIALAPDGESLALVGGAIQFRDLSGSQADQHLWRRYSEWLRHGMFSSDGALYICPAGERTVAVFDVERRELRALLRDVGTTEFAVSPDSRTLACSDRQDIVLLDFDALGLRATPSELVARVWRETGLLVVDLEVSHVKSRLQLARQGVSIRGRFVPPLR